MHEPVIKGGHAARGALLARIRRFAADTGGATALEYAMIAGLILVVITGSLRLFGTSLDGVYARIGTSVSQAN